MLGYYTDDGKLIYAGRVGTGMSEKAHVARRIKAEGLIAAYVAPESNRAAIVDELIAPFDAPQQREAQELAVDTRDNIGEKGRLALSLERPFRCTN